MQVKVFIQSLQVRLMSSQLCLSSRLAADIIRQCNSRQWHRRVCFLTMDSPHNTITNGIISYVRNSADFLTKNGWGVLVVGFSHKVKREQIIKKDGVSYWCFPDRNYPDLIKNILLIKFVFRYRKIKADFSPDILHGQGGYAWPLIFIRNIARVATLHGSEPFWQTPLIEKFFRTLIGRIIYPRLDGLIFINRAVEAAAKKFYPKIKYLPARVIYPGFELFDRIVIPKNKTGKIKIISAGRLEKIKNFHGLIEAFEILKARNLSIELEIYGEGSLRKELGKYAKGALPHEKLMQKISQADLFVLVSFSEVVPNVILEAMSLGTPVVIPAWPTAQELVTDKLSGYIIKMPLNIDNIVSTLQRAIEDFDNWPSIALAGKNLVREKFDSKKNTQIILDFYKTVISKC